MNTRSVQCTGNVLLLAISLLCLASAICTWLIAVRSPLWLDEAISYCQIHSGISEIWARAGLSFPAYSYILWLFSKILGTSEVALRIPSILAMLGAVYLLYRAARELFAPDVAMIAVILFCTHPVVIFAAIDARPYAFAALFISATIYLLVRLRTSESRWLAAAFGAMAAVIVWFQFLFAVIWPALVVGFFAVKLAGRKPGPVEAAHDRNRAMRGQAGVALAAFALAFLPLIPGMLYMFQSRGTHPFAEVPRWIDLAWTIAPGWFPLVLAGAGLLALLITAWSTPEPARKRSTETWQIVLCGSLALVPLLILFVVSRQSSLHIFVHRYRLVAIPGIALSWALIIGWLRPRIVRTLFCVAIVAIVAQQYYRSPMSRRHGYTWKYALEVAEKNASVDNAPVLICSDLPESDHTAMPIDSAKDSNLFAPLSYYKLSVPVVPLPRSLNDEAVRVASNFLQHAAERRERFLGLAYIPSYNTLDWLASTTSGTYDAHSLGSFDDIRVWEFIPRRREPAAQSAK